jgi:hypothetical protein
MTRMAADEQIFIISLSRKRSMNFKRARMARKPGKQLWIRCAAGILFFTPSQ